MIATYASAALICAASLLVGRALFSLAGRGERSWIEPAFGLAAILAVGGLLARAPGHATSAAIGIALLLLAAAAILAADGTISKHIGGKSSRRRRDGGARWGDGAAVVLAVTLVLSLPFAITGRWGLLGVGLNNDLGLHLAWAEWLRSGLGPIPDSGYPLGPHALADTIAILPGIGLGEAFIGELFAIGAITALVALAALAALGSGRRLLATTLVAVSYLGASYFAQGTFKETVQALFVLTTAVALLDLERQRRAGGALLPAAARGRVLFALPWLALAGGVFFAYSFAGLAWPLTIAGLWALTLPEVRAALAPRRLLRLLTRPLTLLALALVLIAGALMTVVGPLGFIGGFNKVAAANTYGPVSPVEAFGVWPTSNYRLDAPGGVDLPWLAGTIGTLAVALGAAWWWHRRELAVPLGLGACLALYLASVPSSGDYSQAKALAIMAPLAMLAAIRPLLTELPSPRRRRDDSTPHSRGNRPAGLRIGWGVLAVAFVGGAAWSSFLALRDAPVGPPGHNAELRSLLPFIAGKPVLYAGQDRYAAYSLRGADPHVPLVEFPDAQVRENPEKPFDTGDAYSPIDFDSFSRGTLDHSRYVITGRATWNSQAPASFRLVAVTDSFMLWERTREMPEDRHVLLEGVNAGARAGCEAPEIRILLANPGRAALYSDVVPGPKERWDEGGRLEPGESTSQRLWLPAGRWRLSLQYFAPFPLTLSAPGFQRRLEPALDGQRPNTISLANNGQFWPAGTLRSNGGGYELTVTADEPSTLQRLTGYADTAYVGNLVAVRAGERRVVPLRAACDSWIDWYESPEAP